jgi:hypothetical protein
MPDCHERVLQILLYRVLEHVQEAPVLVDPRESVLDGQPAVDRAPSSGDAIGEPEGHSCTFGTVSYAYGVQKINLKQTLSISQKKFVQTHDGKTRSPTVRTYMAELQALADEVPNGQTLQEQQRRAHIKQAMDARDADEIPQFAPSKHAGLAFERRISGQNHVLYSLSTAGFAPVAVNPREPALRLYGAFSTSDEAIAFGSVVRATDPHCSLLVHPLGEWALIASTVDELSTAAGTVAERLQRHQDSLAVARNEFEENCREKKQGAVKMRSTSEEAPSIVEVPTAPDGATVYQRHLGGNARLPHQAFAVVSFLRDPEPTESSAQPLFVVHAFLPALEDADRYVRDTLSVEMGDIDIDVVCVGEWLSPEVAIDHPQTLYRDEELHKIMDNHKKEPARVARYNKAMAALPPPRETRDTASVESSDVTPVHSVDTSPQDATDAGELV